MGCTIMMPDSKLNEWSDPAVGDAPAVIATRRGGLHRTIGVTVSLALLVIIADAGYQRAGTTAQANMIEFTQNLAGGFLAVGMTEQYPGFVVLSSLDSEKVDVDAVRYRNWIAGDYTVVTVQTATAVWQKRLRGPVVVLVSAEGGVASAPVDWSWSDLKTIREEADCANPDHGGPHRCGAPFADIFDIVSQKRLPSVPAPVHRFLAPFARPRVVRAKQPGALTKHRQEDR